MKAQAFRVNVRAILSALGIWGVLTLLACSLANAEGSVCERIFEKAPEKAQVRTYEASKTVSQFIRDNAPDYWRWSKKHAEEYFGKLIKYEGIVVGDSHPGNFIYSPLAGKLQLFFMDVKDSGEGAFIVDIAREIMSSNAIFKDGEEDLKDSTERMLDAYIAGLKNEEYEPHDRIQWIFDTKKDQFDEDTEKYIDKQAVGTKFKLKKGMVEPLHDYIEDGDIRSKIKDDIRAAVAKQVPGGVVEDFAYRPRERGGSKNLKRYWALVNRNGKHLILEFKQIEAPAVAQWTEQLPDVERFDLVMKTLWGTTDPLYKAVKISGEAYWMRPKKIDVFQIPYSQKSGKERKFVRHLTAYDCYLLGGYHGKQLKNNSYADQISDNKKQLIKTINQMSADYVDRLTKKVKKLERNDDFE